MKSRFSFGLKLLLIILMLAFAVDKAYAQFGGGSGTPEDPYLIQTAEHLFNTRNSLSSCYLQTEDINLGVPAYNQGLGWLHIGTEVNPFTGVYDGGGYKIANLTQSGRATGVFGYTQNAGISHIRLDNAILISTYDYNGGLAGKAVGSVFTDCLATVSITGGWYTGGLVGQALSHCMFNNCSVSGSVFGEEYTGGLAGSAGLSAFANCTVRADITSIGAYSAFGGLVGLSYDSVISKCNTYGLVSANGSVGGLVGSASNIEIANCGSHADVTGNLRAGGLVGRLSGLVTNSFSIGRVSLGDNNGGLVGITFNPTTVTNSYWNTQTSHFVYSAAGEGRTTAEMTFPYAVNTFVDWDFGSIWSADSTGLYSSGYPYLTENEMFGCVSTVTFSHESGIYTEPIILAMQTDTPFSTIRYTLDGSLPTEESEAYSVPVTIPFTGVVRATAYRAGWLNSPVASIVLSIGGFAGGDGSQNNPYLVENAYQLNNIRFYPNACFKQTANIDLNVAPFNNGSGWEPIGTSAQPFICHFDGDSWTISNLLIHVNQLDAGLFGNVTGSDLKNIKLINVYVNNTSYGAVSTGGLVGSVDSSEIRKCSITGYVQGRTGVGGLIGKSYSTDIIDCYSTASVNSSGFTGGLIAFLYYDSAVTRCFSSGLVSYTGTNPHGGLIGSAAGENPVVVSSYWDIETSGQETSQGGFGRTTDEMTYPYAVNTYTGWNFYNVWQADSTYANSGYPIHFIWHPVALPEITHSDVVNGSPVLVTITCSTPFAVIYYTLDDSTVNQESTLYTEPFWVGPDADSLVIVRARAYHETLDPSYVAYSYIWFGAITETENIIQEIESCQMFPNPVKESMTIRFALKSGTKVQFDAYNLKGQRVRSMQFTCNRGNNELLWDRTSDSRDCLPSGIYFIRLQTGSSVTTKKVILIN